MDVRAIADGRVKCGCSVLSVLWLRAAFLLYAAIVWPLKAWAEDEAKCLERTAVRYALSPNLLHAIRKVEGGRPGFWRRNANGSYDYGVMQINSVWLQLLRPLGYDAYVLTHDLCASIDVAGWILARLLREAGDGVSLDAPRYWRAVGRYHSGTILLNRAYAERVWHRMEQQRASDGR